MSPLVLSRLLTSSVTIKVTTYLLSRELEVDFPSSYVDDCASGVEEGSSKNEVDIIFVSHVKNHEVGRNVVISYFDHNIFHYSLWTSE
jgi:hypothetical protein